MRATVSLKAWPGTANYKPGPASRELLATAEYLAERTALVYFALALPGAEELGIGAWRVVLRDAVLDAGIFYPDDLDETNKSGLEAWAAERGIETPLGLNQA